MLVLRATQEQKDALDGYRNGNSVLRFADKQGFGWVVGKQVLTSPAFEEIRDQLLLLEEVDYIPPQNDEE